MAQLNIHLQPAFTKDLAQFMRLRDIPTKSEAVRIAVREGLERILRTRPSPPDFQQWIGHGLRVAVNPQPRFNTDDDLWEQ